MRKRRIGRRASLLVVLGVAVLPLNSAHAGDEMQSSY